MLRRTEPPLAAENLKTTGLAWFALPEQERRSDGELIALTDELLAGRLKSNHVFTREPFWKPLTADLERPVNKSSGLGYNSLHIDCVNVELPPRIVAFLCLRPDPAGGGANLLTDCHALTESLSPWSLARLREVAFTEGGFYDLAGVGEPLTQFAVIDDERGFVRYSGRMVEAPSYDGEQLLALMECDRRATTLQQQTELVRGDVLVVDQRRFLHGRLPLGPDQGLIPVEQRRLLVQSYWDYAV